jgi:low temperature requirement protein LtrA
VGRLWLECAQGISRVQGHNTAAVIFGALSKDGMFQVLLLMVNCWWLVVDYSCFVNLYAFLDKKIRNHWFVW